MKLSKQKLYKLIQEVMETHLKCFEALEDHTKPEQEYFGSGIQQIIQSKNTIHKKGPWLDQLWLSKNVGERLGAGYSRETYAIDDKLVVKFIIGSPQEKLEGIQSNKLEVALFNKYPTVFPRGYIHDRMEDGPEWLVVERVDVIESGPEYYEVIKNSFSSLVSAADLLSKAGYSFMKRPVNASWVFERLLDAYDDDLDGDVYGAWEEILFSTRAGKSVDDNLKKDVAWNAWEMATNDVDLMTFITTCKNLGVDFEEIREGNIGTNSEKNKLMLIDISKFDFKG